MEVFIAKWDEQVGPTLVDDFRTQGESGDLEALAIQIFMTFQTVFGDSTDVGFNRTFLTFPFKSTNQIGRIILDTLQNQEVRGGKEPYIGVILCPDYIDEDLINEFDSLLIEVSSTYRQKQSRVLKEFGSEFEQKLNEILNMDEFSKDLTENYSLTNAINDFKTGITIFKQNKWRTAYTILKHALLKFEKENQQKLAMEARYLISTILLKLNKYIASYQSFLQLQQLAEALEHQKYFEVSQFLQGFCLYKLQRYEETIAIYETFVIESMEFVNKVQFYSLLGQSYQKLYRIEESSKVLKKGLQMLMNADGSKKNIHAKAEFNYSLGMNFYQAGILTLKKSGFLDPSMEIKIHYNFEKAINYLNESARNWADIDDIQYNIGINLLIASIYGYLENLDFQLHYLQEAYKIAQNIGDVTQKMRIVTQIIQIHEKKGKFAENISLLNSIITSMHHYAFRDTISIAKFHYLLGKNLFLDNQQSQALLELIAALNQYKKLTHPILEQKNTLEMILEIYRQKRDEEHLRYYEDELKLLHEKCAIPVSTSQPIIGILKDIWYYTTSGLELFSYTPEMTFDPTLLGGFLTAMRGFSEEVSKDQLNALVIGDYRYTMYFEPNKTFFIMGRSSIKHSDELIQNTLKILYRKFYQEFQAELANFGGETAQFKKFRKIIPQIDLNLA